MEFDTIVILDFGSQYTQLIARSIRNLKVCAKVLPFNASKAEILKQGKVLGVILSGGPCSVLDLESPMPKEDLFDLELPILGICYGLQLFGHLQGGIVAKSTFREYGEATFVVESADSLLLKNLPKNSSVWNSHGDAIKVLPKGFRTIGRTDNAPYAAIEHSQKRWYALQFHPEVAHTAHGQTLLSNFVYEICGCEPQWLMQNFLETALVNIRNAVGQEHVVLGLSGGVDSSVVAALLNKAIGNQLHCVFVDNGLLRKNEVEEVRRLFLGQFQIPLKVADASEKFLNALAGVLDPEEKRKIIGKLFIEVFEGAIKHLNPKVTYLAQGTIYSDVIESSAEAGNSSTVIKSHHNVGGLPKEMGLKLLEPIRELFKDEVRQLGKTLGLPESLLNRHPFPGPGLAIRIIGDVTSSKLERLRQADSILLEELKKGDLYDKLWQAFCVFLPVKTVGVAGDARTHHDTIAIRAVESTEAMTADWATLPYAFLKRVSTRISNEVEGIGRVVYDISSKPPSTIEWE